MALAPPELVRLIAQLGEVLWWHERNDDALQVCEEGLALLGEDAESVEAAMARGIVANSHAMKGNRAMFRELTFRNAQFLERLPYSEELRGPYNHVAMVYYSDDGNAEEAMKWLQALERKAEQHHDLTALAEAQMRMGLVLSLVGDASGVIERSQRALELSTQIGGGWIKVWALGGLSGAYLAMGDLPGAEETRKRCLEAAEDVQNKRDIARAYLRMGTIWLCQDSRARAAEAFRKAAQLHREVLDPDSVEALATCLLARLRLEDGERQEALAQLREAAALPVARLDVRIHALGWLEEAWDDPEAFRAFCRDIREEHPEAATAPFVQWFLEPAQTRPFTRPPVRDVFDAPLPLDWVLHDPFADSTFRVQNGLEIHAANCRDLWRMNLSAPRLLRKVSGEFAAETICLPVSRETPAMGGLLLWKNNQNFLRLDRGTRGKHEISFSGWIDHRACHIGRGRLPVERVFLRLERVGGHVRAFCSADGQQWYTVGHVDFPVADPVEVGLHAIGNIDRAIYPGAYPEGTAIQFELFQIWT